MNASLSQNLNCIPCPINLKKQIVNVFWISLTKVKTNKSVGAAMVTVLGRNNILNTLFRKLTSGFMSSQHIVIMWSFGTNQSSLHTECCWAHKPTWQSLRSKIFDEHDHTDKKNLLKPHQMLWLKIYWCHVSVQSVKVFPLLHEKQWFSVQYSSETWSQPDGYFCVFCRYVPFLPHESAL